MDRPDELQDIIDNHLLGRITPAEQKKLDEALAADPDLASDLDLEAEAIRAIDALGDQQLKTRLEGLEQRLKSQPLDAKPKEPTAKIIPFYRKNTLAIAAAVLLLLAAGWFVLQSGDSEFNAPATYAANFEPYRNIAVQLTRSAENPTPEQEAYTAYENEDWSQAESLLANLPASDVNNFYLAQVYLKQEKFPEATQLLNFLRKNDGFALHYAAEWYLAMAYLAQGDEDKALPLLKQISETPGHPFASQAADIS
jgi:predicted Zn-dependent protease